MLSLSTGLHFSLNHSRGWKRKEKKKEKGKENTFCGVLTLAVCQVPTKEAPTLPYSAKEGRENVKKRLVGQDKGRAHQPGKALLLEIPATGVSPAGKWKGRGVQRQGLCKS